eukprot:3183980-Rhodomonas_salina.1
MSRWTPLRAAWDRYCVCCVVRVLLLSSGFLREILYRADRHRHQGADAYKRWLDRLHLHDYRGVRSNVKQEAQRDQHPAHNRRVILANWQASIQQVRPAAYSYAQTPGPTSKIIVLAPHGRSTAGIKPALETFGRALLPMGRNALRKATGNT